jgi:hypothetical protein
MAMLNYVGADFQCEVRPKEAVRFQRRGIVEFAIFGHSKGCMKQHDNRKCHPDCRPEEEEDRKMRTGWVEWDLQITSIDQIMLSVIRLQRVKHYGYLSHFDKVVLAAALERKRKKVS